MPRGESLYHKYPDHRVDLEPRDGRVTVRCGGEVLVDTAKALVVNETRHDPVLYFPREDVRMELLERTDHETFCPFKGEASYFSIVAGERREENAVWSYEDPFDQVAGLKDYVAFYPDRVEVD
jgi:uncharacterized protein (DUF427 family)